jgi:hypothetical protein
MKYLHEYVDDRLRLSLREFTTKYPHPVLLHNPPQDTPEDPGYRTAFVSIHDLPEPANSTREVRLTHPLLGLRRALAGGDGPIMAIPVIKRPDGVFQNRISVGRTRSVDISLPHAKVSKLHAYFVIQGAGAEVRGTLTDAGSTNGTFVDDMRIYRDDTKPLRDGAQVRFSQLVFLYHNPVGLYALLNGSSPTRPPRVSWLVRSG